MCTYYWNLVKKCLAWRNTLTDLVVIFKYRSILNLVIMLWKSFFSGKNVSDTAIVKACLRTIFVSMPAETTSTCVTHANNFLTFQCRCKLLLCYLITCPLLSCWQFGGEMYSQLGVAFVHWSQIPILQTRNQYLAITLLMLARVVLSQ